MHQHPLLGVGLENKELDHLFDTVEFDHFRPVVETFKTNIAHVYRLTMFPYVLLFCGSMQNLRLAMFAQAFVKLNVTTLPERLPPEEQAALNAEIDRLVDAEMQKESQKSSMHEEADRILTRLAENDPSSFEVLLQACLVRVWSSFEAFMGDTWEITLNSYVDRLDKSAVPNVVGSQELEEVDGIAQKSIRVDILARYGFDIRHHLGELLRAKCDFTSVEGMNKAFKLLFRNDPPQLGRTAELRRLECQRHVIVHNAGRIDEQYARCVGNESLGVILTLSGTEVEKAAELVTNQGGIFLRALQQRLKASSAVAG